jgi:hypothetical protein
MTRISEDLLLQRVDRAPDEFRVVLARQSTGDEVVLDRTEAGRVVYVLTRLWGVEPEGPE